MRHVTLNALIQDGWLGQEEVFECIFLENFGIFSTSYTASIEQLRMNSMNKIIGRAGAEINGTTDEFVKLTDAISEALYRN